MLCDIRTSYTIYEIDDTPKHGNAMPLTMPWTEDSPAGTLLSQVRDVPLAHLVRDEILASILRGEFSPGERITEPTIASRLGVSRVPVREALRDLEHMGLVESKK